MAKAKQNASSLVSSIVQNKTPSQAIGTIRWRAPETLKSNPEWTEKADIFSLGMVFLEIVSQKMPFENEQDNNIVGMKIRSKGKCCFKNYYLFVDKR
jgi:serine/threonine protein kinase